MGGRDLHFIHSVQGHESGKGARKRGIFPMVGETDVRNVRNCSFLHFLAFLLVSALS